MPHDKGDSKNMLNDHNNVVIFDKTGIPSIMVRFERPKDAKEVPAMFIIEGQVVDAIYISKYPNKVINGRAYSLPMVEPTTHVDFDEAVQACRAKGKGWHLMTAVEWEYVLNQSRAKGVLPRGNTCYGRNHYYKKETGDTMRCKYGKTLAGSGPKTWNHDHTIYGVSDMCGNVWEWVAGLRLKNGVVEYIKDNNAATEACDLSEDSKEWQQIRTNRGTVRVDIKNGDIAIVDSPIHEEYEPDYGCVKIEDLIVDLENVPQALKDVGIAPDTRLDIEKGESGWFDATEERLPLRGSSFHGASSSGASALFLHHARTSSYGDIGFRSAFYEVNEKRITD